MSTQKPFTIARRHLLKKSMATSGAIAGASMLGPLLFLNKCFVN